MIRAIIFDLDKCIFNTHSLGEGILAPVLAPLDASDLPEETKRSVREALWSDPLHIACKRFAVPAAVEKAMRNAYRALVVPTDRSIETYGDESVIAALPVRKFLVTTGYAAFQQSKIDRLGIAALFESISIDTVDDPSSIKGKKQIFAELLAQYGLQKEEVLVVGDNPRSELGAGKELGIVVVQTLRPGVERWAEAQHHIKSFAELAALIK